MIINKRNEGKKKVEEREEKRRKGVLLAFSGTMSCREMIID